MPTRSLSVNGKTWKVYPSGRITQLEHDEFGLVFVAGTGPGREVRLTRYSPVGVRGSRERSLMELSNADLARLLRQSQPSDTSPEADYSA